MAAKARKKATSGNIRYAVVGLGHIAQVAVLPGFKNAKNSELTGLVSGSPTKLSRLSKKYSVKNTWNYDEYEECLHSGLVDAVFIALPNDMHREYTVRAARAGIHVLCEKPLAVTARDCQ
ncbi:MAG TPA: Gfo/Idh/MocA family oxidoreductase, partial [Candidatus Kapabacteria bacterium]|nr:Gfo/Idh/MocA family oxidoreductase [Candidatus Kapabacteria bacterium]